MTAAAAVGVRPPRRHRPALTTSLAPVVTGVVVAAFWAVLGLVRQHTMRSGIDLGLYTQAVAGYARGQPPWSSLKTADGRFDLLGDHFTPVMALLAPAYRIWPHPSTLIVAQAVLIGLGVAVLAGTARRVFGSAAAAAAVGLALGLSWGIAGRLTAVERRLAGHDARFDDLAQQVDTGFAEIRGRLDATAAGQQTIVDLLTGLIDGPEPSAG